jgi:hypothetical protein
MPPTAPTPPEPAARHRRGIGPAVLGVVVALGTAMALAGTPSAAQDGPTTTKDPVASASAALDRARVVREQADARLAAVRADKARVEKEMANLDGEDATLTTELADARRQVREFAVAAYIDGGQTELVRASLTPEQASALAWRTGLVSGQAGQASDAADRYRALQASNDPDRVAAALELDRVTRKEAEAASDLQQASALERDADAAYGNAFSTGLRQVTEHQQRAQRAAAAAPTPGGAAQSAGPSRTARAARSLAPSVPGAASPAVATSTSPSTGGATADELAFLAQVRRCESRNNYAAISASGRYRGAYQFSVQTWRGVGGSGDPAAASPAEQDRRALALLRLQGRRAWPVCGR